MSAFEKDVFQNYKKDQFFFLYEALRLQGGSPEVGDLQRSSEVLDPSLESQVAVGATRVVIKHGRISPLGLLSARLTKAILIPMVHTYGENIRVTYLSKGRDNNHTV